MLAGGDRRSIGRAGEALGVLEEQPSLLHCLVEAMRSPDQLVCMRAADAVQKFAARHPGFLQPEKENLLLLADKAVQQEVRWHLAQILPGLSLNQHEREEVYRILCGYLHDRSAIVRTFAMQGLADLADQEAGYREKVLPILIEQTQNGSPAMKSRGRKLISALSASSTAHIGKHEQ